MYLPSLETSSCQTPSGDSPHIWTDMNGQALNPARDESCALESNQDMNNDLPNMLPNVVKKSAFKN